jgi:hypothetical protein
MKLLASALWEHVLVILWWFPGTFILLQSCHRHNQSWRTRARRYSSSQATHDLQVWLTSMWWVKLCLQMQELLKSSSPKNYGVVWSLYLPFEYSIFSNHKTLQGWSKSIEEITLYLDGWIYMGTGQWGQWGSFSFKLVNQVAKVCISCWEACSGNSCCFYLYLKNQIQPSKIMLELH